MKTKKKSKSKTPSPGTMPPSTMPPNSMPTFEQAVALHQQGNLEAAETLYRELLDASPEHVDALINLGKILRDRGDSAQAQVCYQQAIDTPHPPKEVFYNLGNLHIDQHRLQEAEQCFSRALTVDPQFSAAYYQRGRVWRDLQRWTEAIADFEKALQLSPKLTNAWLDCGNVKRTVGNEQEALYCYQQVLKLDANNWKAHYSILRILDDATPMPLRESHFKAALQHCPDPWQVYLGLGQTYIDRGQFNEAHGLLQKALEVDPNRLQAALPLVQCLLKLGHHDAAKTWWEKISASQRVELITELADIIWQFNYWQDGIELLKQAANIQPDAATFFNLANAHERGWQLNDALTYCEKARLHGADESRLLALEASVNSRRGDVEAAFQLYRKRYAEIGPQSANSVYASALYDCASSLAYSSLYSDQFTAQQSIDLHREIVAPWEQNRENVVFPNTKDPLKRIRLGFVTSDLHFQHPVDIFLQPVLDVYDKNQFETFVYYSSHSYDTHTWEAKKKVHHWCASAGWSDERLRAQIMHDQIDVLVDTSGHTDKHRLKMFARRSAPVQVSMIGYPHSTGLSQMDYLVGDNFVTPIEYAHLCSEKVMRLPHCVFAFPREDIWGEVDAARMHKRREIVFGSFNNIPKLTPKTVALWAQILKRLSSAKLLLKAPSFQDAGTVSRYINLFAAQGVKEDQLLFRGPTGLSVMMQEYNDIDIALDPSPYNGGTTTYQALWMGAPVITLAGENFCQRMGTSILTNVGLVELVAQNAEEYVDIACRLAEDRQRLFEMKSALRPMMMTAPLCDTKIYTKNLENEFRQAWVEWCN